MLWRNPGRKIPWRVVILRGITGVHARKSLVETTRVQQSYRCTTAGAWFAATHKNTFPGVCILPLGINGIGGVNIRAWFWFSFPPVFDHWCRSILIRSSNNSPPSRRDDFITHVDTHLPSGRRHNTLSMLTPEYKRGLYWWQKLSNSQPF